MLAEFLKNLNTLHWLLLALVLVILFEICYKRLQFREITSKMPCAWGLPFFGIGNEMIPFRKNLYTFTSYFDRLKTLTYFTWLGKHPLIVTVDPEVIKRVLTSEHYLTKARILYAAIDHALPDGIITSSGAKWKHNRKLLNSSFTHKILTGFIPIITKGTELAIHEFNSLVGRGEQQIFELLKHVILKTALETTMGIPIEKSEERLAENFNFVLDRAAMDIMYSTCNLSFLLRTTKYYKALNYLRDFVFKLLKHKYDTEQKSEQSSNPDDDIKKSSDIFIDRAFSYHKRGLFQTSDVVSETQTMIAGSFETVSTLMYSAIVMLAMHSDVQEKLFDEVCCTYPSKEVQVDYEQFDKLPYMTMVLEETMRLMPSIPLIGRQAVLRTHLTDDIELPQDMQVLIPIYTLHRREDVWGPAANAFNPDNFLPENTLKRHPYAYMPFSKGNRNCVGWRYAYIAMRVMLIGLVRNFKFSTSFKYDDLVFRDEISLRYYVEPAIKIERRPDEV